MGHELAAIASMLSDLGIDLRPKALPTSERLNPLIQPVARIHTAIVVGTRSVDYPDPEDFSTLVGRAGAGRDIGSYNNANDNWLVDRVDTTFRIGRREQLYITAQRADIGEGGFITLCGAKGFGPVKLRDHGLVGSEFCWPAINPHGNNWTNVWTSKHEWEK